MRRSKLIGSALCSGVFALCISHAGAQEFTGKLSGFNEIGTIPGTIPSGYTGAVLSDGRGTAKLDLDRNAGTIAYTLKYKNVGVTPPKTGSVLFAHIHFGKSRDSGGVLVFFCSNVTPFTGTGPTPPSCNTDSTGSGTVSGMWTYQDVQAIPGQNVQAGAGASGINPAAFDALVDALDSNTAYANIHTTPGFPGGEIRGQCRSGDREQQGDQGNQ